MRHKPRFRLWRPGRRSARRQVAALRAKTAQARMQLADTDAMLACRRPAPRGSRTMRHIVLSVLAVAMLALSGWHPPSMSCRSKKGRGGGHHRRGCSSRSTSR